ncbi:coiled-coil domain-containing protein [Vibrio rotiferianus]|uniref:hypothetical protein n=1 Tax=Vibrio rotiferianus TaxID=190895 RepID=UPI002895B1F0|nr:hypothetical protein THOE12_130070 [Vibrio rotiferianus]
MEKSQELEAELELAKLHIHQLQEELEQYYLKCESVKVINPDNNVLISSIKNRNKELEAELELSLLHTYQLKEELEYYYLETIKLKEVPNRAPALQLLREKRLADSLYKQSEHARYVDKLLTENINLTTGNIELKEWLNALELENGDLKVERDEAKARESKLSSRFSLLASQLSNLTTENSELTESSRALENQVDKIQDERNKALEERNLAESRVQDLTLQLEQDKQQSEAIESDLLSSIQSLEARISHFVSRNADFESRNSSLETLISERESRIEHLDFRNAELESRNSHLESLISERESRIEHLDFRNADLESRNSHLESLISERESRISYFDSRNAKLESEKAEVTEQRDSEHKLHLENKNWAESINSELEQVKVELAEKNRSVNLSQKMLVKAQVDLDHLRNSYAEKLEAEKELVELVKELREKLTLASEYYFKIQQENQEL